LVLDRFAKGITDARVSESMAGCAAIGFLLPLSARETPLKTTALAPGVQAVGWQDFVRNL